MRTKALENETVKHIAEYLNVTRHQARTVRDLAKGRIDLTDDTLEAHFPKTYAWVRQCYHRPNNRELIMSAIDETIGTFGAEGVEIARNEWLDYCNTGDTYGATVCRWNDKLFLATWGYCVEQLERQGYRIY